MNDFFPQLLSFLEKEVVPIASQLDEDPLLFCDIYQRFVQLGGLRLLVPKELGGLGGGRQDWIEYNILVARYSGALLFLQAQHQFCISRLQKLLPQQAVQELFKEVASGSVSMGLGLQKNKNLLQVEQVKEGYRVTGTLPWVTGSGYFSHLLISLEQEGVLFYYLLPFKPQELEGGSMTLSSKIETTVFNAVPSHAVTFTQWLLKKETLLASEPVGINPITEHPSAYNFAGATKALFVLIQAGRYGATQEIKAKQRLLETGWETYHQKLLQGGGDPWRLRAEGRALAEEALFLAKLSCGTAALLKGHPLERLAREIWQYTLAGYSEDQRKVYVEACSKLG